MDLKSFKEKILLPQWWSKLSPFFETNECFEIYKHLKKRSKEDKVIILPKSSDTFKAFNHCDYYDIKVVIINQEPYSTFIGKTAISTGIAFDCNNTNKLQPSLEYLWKSIQNNFPEDVISPECDLSFLCKQGILLINYSFTAEKNLLESHLKPNLWEPFIKYLLEDVFYGNSGIHYVLMGKHSHKAEKYISPLGNYIYKTEHPSYWARNHNTDCNADFVWKKINKLLKVNGQQQIIWNKTTYEKPVEIFDELPF